MDCDYTCQIISDTYSKIDSRLESFENSLISVLIFSLLAIFLLVMKVVYYD